MSEVEISKNDDLLGLVLSAEFNECSIAAAEANKAAYEMIRDKSQPETLYAVDTYVEAHDYSVVHLNGAVGLTGDNELSLIQPLPKKQRKFSLKSLAVERSAQVVEEPMLVAMIEQDVFLPLATFARREGGICSWIQLGTEMKDDNFFVTTEDENSSRHRMVEAIRALQPEETRTDGGKQRVYISRILQPLFDSEIRGKERLVDKAREAELVRRAYELVDSTKSRKELVMLSETNNEVISSETTGGNLYLGCDLGEGRFISLCLAKNDTNSNLQLLAIFRGDLALPIAGFDQNSGAVNLFSYDKVGPTKRGLIVKALRKALMADRRPADSYTSHNSNTEFRIVETCLVELGLMENNGKVYNAWDKRQAEVRRKVSEYVVNPASICPYPQHPALKNAITSNKRRNAPALALCETLDIAERLRSRLGHSSPEEELLVHKVNGMSELAKSFSAVARDRKIGKTTGDADISVRINRQISTYSVVISGKPHAVDGEPLRPILTIEFDAAHPIFGRDKFSDEAAATRASNVLDILNLFN